MFCVSGVLTPVKDRAENYILTRMKGKNMKGKKGKAPSPIELQFEDVKNNIAGLKPASQTGPWILLLFGALVTTVGFFSGRILVGILGIPVIVIAWIWSDRRSGGKKTPEDTILQLKGELSRIEKEP